MSQEQLMNFITQSRAIGKSDEVIKQELLAAGWQESLILAAFSPMPPIPIPVGNDDITIRYAGFWHRVAASLVDGIIVSVGFGVITIPLGILDYMGFFPSELIVTTLIFLLSIAVAFWYYPYMEAKKGYTFGKQFIGIRVKRDETNQNLTLKRSGARFLVRLLSVVTFGIGFLMAAFTKKKQALHDIVVGSIVVSTPRVNGYRTALSIILGFFGPILLMVFIFPLIVAFMFGAVLTGFVGGMEDMEQGSMASPEELFTFEPLPERLPVSLTIEELDALLASTSIQAISNIEPQAFAEGYVLAGPTIVTWDQSWNDEVVLYLPVYQGIALSEYVTVDIFEVIDGTGTNVYDPNDDSGSIVNSYRLAYEVGATSYDIDEISRDFGFFESLDPMQRVRGTVRFTIPLVSGDVYERSFEFDLSRQQ